MILSRCEIHRGCTIAVFFGEKAGGRIPWPDPDLKPDAERDFPGLVPIDLKHFPKDQNVKAREAISALTVQVAELLIVENALANAGDGSGSPTPRWHPNAYHVQ